MQKDNCKEQYGNNILQYPVMVELLQKYYANKEYIAKVLCVNKLKPEMHCNGKCCLAKKLKEQDKQDQQAPNQKKEKFDVQPYFIPQQFSLTSIEVSPRINHCYIEQLNASPFRYSIFRPPVI